MDDILKILELPLFTIAGQAITTGRILLIIVVLLVALVASRWIERAVVRRLTARQFDPNLVQLISRIIVIVTLALLFVFVLQLLNIPVTAFAFVSGAIAIGVGFGAQNIINNFISGWILMWERPIRIGDFLEVGDVKGIVEAINTRSTRIRRVDGVHLLIPNSFLLENTVVNWTLIDRLIRNQVRVGVAYGSPVRQVAELIERAIREHTSVLEEPAPLVLFEDFGDSALIFDAYFWAMASGERDLRVVRSDIRFRIDALFREHGITIAFPQRDVHLDSLSPIEVKLTQS